MQITKTLHVTDRKAWRSWLKEHHNSEPEIWLVYHLKNSGKPRIPYSDAVEEALCYGWIDSTMKKIEDGINAQRFSPRKKNSNLSEMNKVRVRRLIKAKKMTKFGLESIKHHLDEHLSPKKFELPEDILKELRKDPNVWNNFQKFPSDYQQIRIGWIAGVRKRPEEFKKRLRYFIKMTLMNKKFGMVR
ncbi:MAG: YdeI family protein [Candidatus Kapaibacterium sp.]